MMNFASNAVSVTEFISAYKTQKCLKDAHFNVVLRASVGTFDRDREKAALSLPNN